ncbi:hypothetical protein EON80_03215 [bacterium]|nr:MAG: hypothetical protein EON80_03215 [bacterium]
MLVLSFNADGDLKHLGELIQAVTIGFGILVAISMFLLAGVIFWLITSARMAKIRRLAEDERNRHLAEFLEAGESTEL